MIRSELRKPKTILLLILLALFIVLLTGYAIAGFSSRYLADDYCNDVEFMQHGFWYGQIHSYLNPMPYSNERYSLTLKSGIDWLMGGVRFVPFMPLLSMIFWVLAVFYAVRQVARYSSYPLSFLITAFISVCLIFFTLYLAPNRYQVLFWRSAMNTYLMPLMLNTFIVGRFFYYLKRNKFHFLGYFELGFLAFLAAGFSETVLAFQVGFWGIILCLMVWRRNSSGIKAAGAILVGSFLGAIVMILNPLNSYRQSHFPPPPPLWRVALMSVAYAFDFLRFTIRGSWLPFLILSASGFLLGWMEWKLDSFPWRKAFWSLAAAAILTGILLICIMAPTIWSMSAYPEMRGLLAGVYVLNLFIFFFGIWIAIVTRKIMGGSLSPKFHLTIGIVFTVIIGVYLIRVIWPTYELIGVYQKRAQLWDARDAEILKLRSEGQTMIVVPGIDSIGGILELQPETGWQWVNICAAEYYQVKGIVTTE